VSLDERALQGLVEDSQDLQSDAMRTTNSSLAEMVELGHERRARGIDPDEIIAFGTRRKSLLRSVGLVAGGGFGAAVLNWLAASPASAMGDDVATMQTAAALENLAVATYTTALSLPFMADVPPVVKAFATKTREQHGEHAKAFNAAAKQLGGVEQMSPHPGGLDIVNKAKPGLKGPADVVDLAIALETIAAQTYSANAASVSDINARKVVASVMGVEAQHVAILNAVKALLAANAPQLITLPPDAAKLPAAAGSIGFPDAFLKTDQAVPATSGAVK
jgi:rubrerythrin